MAHASAVDDVFALASQLSPEEKARLIAELARDLAKQAPARVRPPLLGMAADLGPAPSADDIETTRREMLGDGG